MLLPKNFLLLIALVAVAFPAAAWAKPQNFEIFAGHYTGTAVATGDSDDVVPADISFTSSRDGRSGILVVFANSTAQGSGELLYGNTFAFWKGKMSATGDQTGWVTFNAPASVKYRWKSSKRSATIEASMPVYLNATGTLNVRITVALKGRTKRLSVVQTITFPGNTWEHFYNGTARAAK